MTQREIKNEYFDGLCGIVCKDLFAPQISYKKLLSYLYNTDFRYIIPKDQNRAEDGIALRERFGHFFYGPCSVLEMMIGLALRCEESIMDDPRKGDRTAQWFWGMITNLGLGSMTDDRFNPRLVEDIVETFLDRRYDPDGKGGLFRVRNCDRDLRDVEIWIQLLWYLDNIA